jgi:hypothetical protein
MFERWVTRPDDRARLESNALCHRLLLFARALAMLAPSTSPVPRFRPRDALLAFLASL